MTAHTDLFILFLKFYLIAGVVGILLSVLFSALEEYMTFLAYQMGLQFMRWFWPIWLIVGMVGIAGEIVQLRAELTAARQIGLDLYRQTKAERDALKAGAFTFGIWSAK